MVKLFIFQSRRYEWTRKNFPAGFSKLPPLHRFNHRQTQQQQAKFLGFSNILFRIWIGNYIAL